MVLAKTIPSSEQHWVNESYVDPNGRVFEWGGEIYRALTPPYAERWKELVGQGVIQGLVRDGLLVDSELTNLITESGEKVLRHRRVPVVSYCYEWIPDMLRQAALVTLELCIRLADRGLTLQDGHPWNVLFDGTSPIYIDAGSITPASNDILWAPYQQFCNFFLFPLYLYASGNDRIARWLLRDYLTGVSDQDLLAALPVSFKVRHPRLTLSVAFPRCVGKFFGRLPEELQERFLAVSKVANSGPASKNLKLKFLDSLHKNVATLKLGGIYSPWTRYYHTVNTNYFGTELSPDDWENKQRTINQILADIRPESVLDIGANTGRYAKIAAGKGARVTACEVDVPALTVCYEEARKDNVNILPLVANVFSDSPTPGRGGTASPSPTQRFRSDFVMGLALIHHVVAIQRMTIARICEIVSGLSDRWLLVEFVPPLKPKLGADPVPLLDDFTTDDLENCLNQRFNKVSKFPSYPQERNLFLCEK